MNKNRIFIFTMIAGLYFFTACNDDFMNRFPLTSVSDESYFNTVNDLRAYANKLYEYLPNVNSGWETDNSSDNQVPQNPPSFIWGDHFIQTAGDGWGRDDWREIRRCNYFLQRYHKATGNQAEINRFVGEILFFKAFQYYDKLTRYGDVPWLSSDLNLDSPELYAARTPRNVVVDSIVENLDRAIRFLPETMLEERLSRYAALALKSRICLFEGTFRKYHGLGNHEPMLRLAADAALQIMQSERFSLYSTGNPETDLHSFFQLYTPEMRASGEAIFFANYVFGLRAHNRPREVNEARSGMSKDFARSFLMRTDGLPWALSDDYMGDDTFADEFENRDFRMKQTIYTSDQPYYVQVDGTVTYQATPLINDFVPTGYRIYKMLSTRYIDREPNRAEIAQPIFRYGEVLLNYAEAKAELGEWSDEVMNQTINLLRARAGMPHMQNPIPFVDPNWPDWEVPVTPLINEIRRERRVELATEGFRFNDLRRWKAGKLLDNPETYLGARNPDTGQYHRPYTDRIRPAWHDKLYL